MADWSFIVSAFLLVALLGNSNFAFAQSAQEQVREILKNLSFNEALIKDKIKTTTYQGNKFAVDGQGLFYKEGPQGIKFPLEIYFGPVRDYTIFERQQPSIAGLAANPWKVAQSNDFDDIVVVQRQYGIFSMKNKNPECYFAYAAERLGPTYMDRLLSLERSQNPRPLAFAHDNDWEDFKNDIKNLLSLFRGKDSFVAIIGTSTTFFSENPLKGKNAALFESAPQCTTRAKDPLSWSDVYTFDTPGAEISDIDVHILIPELSSLCNNANVFGNDGRRVVYFENTLDKCLSVSPNEAIRNLVIPTAGSTQTLRAASPPNKPFGQFLSKWMDKLKREINFSVVIRPDLRKGSLFRPENNFSQDSYLKRRFVIPLD